MANFHENVFAIAANEENMRKVLLRMAMNFAANKEYTSFDIRRIEGCETAEDMYRVVAWVIDACYVFAFAGAPIPEGVESDGASGWSSPTSSEGEFMKEFQALTDAMGQFNANNSEGVNANVSSFAPVARPMSDSAIVGFSRYGDNWLLTIGYATAWSPNSEDVDEFFMGLPRGDYGVAFYDSDEYDDYGTISVFSGLHHGLAGMDDVEGDCERGVIEQTDLKARKRNYAEISMSDLEDIAELAKIGATNAWTEWDGEEDEGCGDDGELHDSWGCPPSINWASPTKGDFIEIDQLIFDAMGSFPWVHRIDGGIGIEDVKAAEHLFPGDVVTVSSDWSFVQCDNAPATGRISSGKPSFRICDQSGNVIGCMGGWKGFYFVRDSWGSNYDSSPAILACILPHLRATIWDLRPGSLHGKIFGDTKFSVRFDLDPVSADDLIAEAHALLEKDLKDRALSSKKGE